MKNIIRLISAPAIVLAVAIASPSFAQDAATNTAPDTTGSQSMHHAGESLKDAASNTADAAKHTYHGAKIAVKDTAITAKVKTALHNDKLLHDNSDIHVDTVGRVVTLTGTVPSLEAAHRAQEIAAHTTDVASVKNALTVTSAGNTETEHHTVTEHEVQ
jgi:hyperosmotically inducible protein